MKKFWDFIKPTLVMLAGFLITLLIQSVVGAFVSADWATGMFHTLSGILICAVVMLLLGISIDRRDSKFGFIPMLILMILFPILNIIFAGRDPISSIATVGNWEFSLIRMLWYDVTDYLSIPTFTVNHEMLINVTSIVISIIIVFSFMLLGSLMHRKKKD